MAFSFSGQGGVFVFEVKTFTESSDDLMFCAYGRVFHNDIIPSYISEDHKEYPQCFNVLSIDKLQIFKISSPCRSPVFPQVLSASFHYYFCFRTQYKEGIKNNECIQIINILLN